LSCDVCVLRWLMYCGSLCELKPPVTRYAVTATEYGARRTVDVDLRCRYGCTSLAWDTTCDSSVGCVFVGWGVNSQKCVKSQGGV
jgi:hypothetical protein